MIATQQRFKFRTHGGKRAGAGRKPRAGKKRVKHVARPAVTERYPLHITVRMKRDLPWLRRFYLAKVLQRAFVHGCDMGTFRICQFSIQRNHIHLICEASDSKALARGMKGWSVRVARGINGKLERGGSVFDDRYHCEILKTPRQTRNALCYVLQNARRHGEQLDSTWNGIDPFSSAWWFDGWNDEAWRQSLRPSEERCVASARSFLLTEGWRRHGLIGVEEVPRAAAN
jgi:REP element-mobilizing transposase RayT